MRFRTRSIMGYANLAGRFRHDDVARFEADGWDGIGSIEG
jgi:hypothetical protein